MSKEDIERLIHPYIPAKVNGLEKWLKDKAAEGWQLVEKRGWSFTFQKCKSYEAEYFMYSGFDASKGMSFDYHMAKTKYGKSAQKSKLNKLPQAVFEVDTEKSDEQLLQYKKMRDSFYFRHYVVLSMTFALVFVFLVVLATYKNYVSYFAFVILVALIYSIISLFIIGCDRKNNK